MQLNPGWRASLAMLLACVHAVAAASSYELRGDGLQRVEAAVVDELASWQIEAGRLVRVRHDGSAALGTPLVFFADADRLAGDGALGVWLASGDLITHYDAALQARGAVSLGMTVQGIVAAGPNALFVVTGDAIARIDGDLHVAAAHARLPGPPDDLRALAFDRAAGTLWIVRRYDALRFDALDLAREPVRFAVPDAATATLDTLTGELWIVNDREVHVLDRAGTVALVVPVPAAALAQPDRALIDSAGGRLYVGDALGVSALDLATRAWTRVVSEPHASLADEAVSLVPVVDLAFDRPTSQLRVRVQAACRPRACAPDIRYARHAHVGVTVDDLEVSPRLDFIDSDTWSVSLDAVQSRDDAVVRVVAVDVYGNVGSTRRTDVRTLRAQARAKANAPPTIAITAPANNTIAVAPASFTIAATATDPDGTIAKVEFYRSGVLLGTDATAPYTWAWGNVAVGTYSLTAKAYDNAGAITVSAPVSVQVKANVAPTVTLTSPPNNSNFVAPATITLSATASDSDGTIAKVDFLRGGSTLIGSVTSAPYSYAWTNVAGGTYSLTARATDDKGATTTSAAVTAKVNNPPNVSITAPANNASLVAPVTVTIQAAASDTDGTVAKVEFFQNGTLLGTDTVAPYSYAWANPQLGNYALTAKATDNLGATRTSSPVAISVKANQPPTVTLTSPAADLQRVAGTSLAVTATAADPDGTVAKVEFRLGGVLMATDTTAPYTGAFTVPLGTFPLAAVATDNKGAQSTSATVQLTGVANQRPTVSLDAPLDGQSFPAATPPDIALRATASDADGTIVRVRFMVATHFVDGSTSPATVLATVTQAPYSFLWHAVPFTVTPLDGQPSQPESYEVWAEADDDAGDTGFPARAAIIKVPNASPWSIAIDQPGSDAEFSMPATVVVVATPRATGTANLIRSVEFLADGTSLAALTSANGALGEYVHVWRNVAPGQHSLMARLTDAAGFVVPSDATSVHVRSPDQLPTIALASPPLLLDRVGVAGSTISLSANAADADGTVTAVEYLGDGQVVASAAPPFAATWTGVAPGIHTVRARAVDDRGREATSPLAFLNLRISERLPVATLVAPAPGATYRAGAGVTLEADAVSPDGVIGRVDFVYVPSNAIIGSATTAPYRVTWIVPQGNGTYTIRANVTTVAHNSAASTPVTVNVSSNSVPVVALTAPRDGQAFAVGAAVALAATASDPDGAIAKVEFLVNGAVVATATTAPYTASWTPAATGAYALSARATDNSGASAPSSVATITVLPAVASIVVTSPLANAIALAGQPLAITAQGTLPAHTLARIDFLVDGTLMGNVPFAGTASGIATYTWVAPSPGAHALSARVVATDGTSLTSASVPVQISDFGVTLAEPFAGQSFLAPGDIRIFASPTSSGSTVTRVDFLGDGVVLGSTTAPPYLYVWRGMGAGTHTVTARAVDSSGLTVAATTTVNVVGTPSLVVDGGIDGSSIADDAGVLTGTVVAPRNASLVINGQLASLDSQGRFFLENLLLQPGINKVVLWLNTHDAPPVSQTVTINSTASAPFAVDLSPQHGFAPLAAVLSIRNRTATTYQRVEVDSNDDGTPEQTFASAAGGELRIAYTLPAPGLYRMRVTVYDAANQIVYQARRQARVYDRAELAGSVVDVYWSMVDRLAANDPSAALRLFTADAQDRYADVFATLGSGIAGVAPQLRRIVDGVIGEDIAELTHARDTPNGPQVFMIYLVRGRDGLWRIETM